MEIDYLKELADRAGDLYDKEFVFLGTKAEDFAMPALQYLAASMLVEKKFRRQMVIADDERSRLASELQSWLVEKAPVFFGAESALAGGIIDDNLQLIGFGPNFKLRGLGTEWTTGMGVRKTGFSLKDGAMYDDGGRPGNVAIGILLRYLKFYLENRFYIEDFVNDKMPRVMEGIEKSLSGRKTFSKETLGRISEHLKAIRDIVNGSCVTFDTGRGEGRLFPAVDDTETKVYFWGDSGFHQTFHSPYHEIIRSSDEILRAFDEKVLGKIDYEDDTMGFITGKFADVQSAFKDGLKKAAEVYGGLSL